jgi:hypothetical protein
MARALSALDAENQIIHLRDKFPANTTDIDWIRNLDRESGWVIVSADQLYRVPHQREALIAAGFVAFYLKKGWNQPLWVQASRLFAWWPVITAKATRARAGECFKVPFKGHELEAFSL